jgi:mannose-1-phosphate guanylyltransferase
MKQNIVPVILSGGAGTRLWPLSLPEKPKQFHALTGDRSMLRMTAERVAGQPNYAAPIVVASERHAGEVAAELAAAGASAAAIILEPMGRNTAAAIALAALEAGRDALLLVMPSDHVIADPAAFHAAIAKAVPHAAAGYLVTFGIEPTEPETGYGYIRAGAALADGVFAIQSFVEKPDRATATGYLQDGGYYWNGGIFLFRSGAVIGALAEHAGDILAGARAALSGASRDGVCVRPDRQAFAAIRSQSIDYAVMEVHRHTAVVPVAMGWSDVGSWDALHAIARDQDGNHLAGPVLAHETRNCLLRSDGPRLIACGVEDLIVVATGDVVIILPRGDSQRVKEMADWARGEGG